MIGSCDNESLHVLQRLLSQKIIFLFEKRNLPLFDLELLDPGFEQVAYDPLNMPCSDTQSTGEQIAFLLLLLCSLTAQKGSPEILEPGAGYCGPFSICGIMV